MNPHPVRTEERVYEMTIVAYQIANVMPGIMANTVKKVRLKILLCSPFTTRSKEGMSKIGRRNSIYRFYA